MNRTIQSDLLKIAGSFLLLQAIIFSLSPVVREHTWAVSIPWGHWIALIILGGVFYLVHREIALRLPDADPYLLPSAVLLSGWGVLTIWRLDQEFGIRQALWLAISLGVIFVGTRIPSLKILQRYKYVLLMGGLSLTALTLLFGTNPSGFGPRLWLGCCDVYYQPSEPLKLLLIIFLSAYLAEKLPYRLRTIHTLFPTVILSGIVILLLLLQRDLGTASIFLALYTSITYLATNRKRILVTSLISIILVGVAGYFLVGIINIRISSWLDPWIDPGGNSYQVIQALISIANGGIEGRGLGLGYPDLVPIALSDFMYSAIAEETGLIGTLGLLAVYGLILNRGFRIALRAPDVFRRLLAAGISTYIGIQTILIVGGNLRLLPLTGVTLPFVSYGGSSLLTSFIALVLLLSISNHLDEEPAPLEKPAAYLTLNTILSLGLFASALASGWWAVVRAPALLQRPDNLRRVIEERYVPRGLILDRSNAVITKTSGVTGSYSRLYVYPDLAPVTGYSNSTYGQAGLEASMDGYLRGLDGNPAINIWREHLLYGMSPPGLDIRLSINLSLQSRADELMRGQSGAVVILNAQSGEVLAMASHPTYDPNELREIAGDLLVDPGKPLINRAASGLYPTGSALEPFAGAIENGDLSDIYNTFAFNGFLNPRLESAVPFIDEEENRLYSSPLQMALASAAFSNNGVIPAPRIAMAVKTSKGEWLVLPAVGMPTEAIQPSEAREAVNPYVVSGDNFWSHTAQAEDAESDVTWFIGGTPPNWRSTPLVVAVVLEKTDPTLARRIGRELLLSATNP
ncbi:MAG TPA: FtsW/RodA/SpoVE family cell cycle protein [Anaerolineales bacterium]|nr:FtsW/RodA/SpoVE family cell cycle protein [Anaerolineales bacterium]